MKCSNCDRSNMRGAAFCAGCGYILPVAGAKPNPASTYVLTLPRAAAAPVEAEPESQRSTPFTRRGRLGFMIEETPAPPANRWGLRVQVPEAGTLLAFGILLLLMFGIAALATPGLAPGQTITAAVVFTAGWGLFFAASRYLRHFLASLALLLVLGVCYFMVDFGLAPPPAFLYAFLTVAVLATLLFLLPLLPGLAVALVLYQTLGPVEGLWTAIGAFAVVSLFVLAGLLIFPRYIMAFGRGFLWSYLIALLVHRMTMALVLGAPGLEWVTRVQSVAGSAASDRVAQLVLLLNRLVVDELLAGPIWLWFLLMSALIGIFAIAFDQSAEA